MTKVSETAFQLELGLQVARLDDAASFYTTLFGAGPVRRLPDFARFEVDDPPVVLTLRAGTAEDGGAINHVGFRVEDAARLIGVQHRLELAGIATEREEGVECCYSRQTKFWVTDPDRNLWEVYSLDEEDEVVGGDDPGNAAPDEFDEMIVWGHRTPEPLQLPIPCGDNSVDEIHLDGTLDDRWGDAECSSLLQDVLRALRPGGAISVRTTIQSWDELPDVIDVLDAAGFLAVQVDQLDADATEVRWSLRLSAAKPHAATDGAATQALYRGPAAFAIDDRGREFPRGQRVAIDASTSTLFSQRPFESEFVSRPREAE